MTKNTASIPAKSTGSNYTAAEFETLRGFVDAPLQDLETFDGSLIQIDGTASYDNFTMSANLEFTFAESGHERGNMKIVKITSDGTKTLTFTRPTAYPLVNYTGLTNEATLASGINIFGFFFDGTEISIYKRSGENVINSAPLLSSIAVASDNGSVTLTFNKGCYANNDGTGDLQVADFTPSLAGGTATSPILSVPTHSAGDSIAGCTLAYTGTADGNEVLTITPADSSSAYEISGIAMDAGQTANDNLEDQTAPVFSSAEVGNIDDTTIRITMSEACDPTSTPATTAFTPAGIASTPTVSNVNITSVYVDLTLSSAVVDSDTPTIAYTKPGSNFLKDTATTPNETASWTAETVTNNVSSILLSDDFTGTTIDTGKWTVVETNPTDVEIAQNDELQLTELTTNITNYFDNYISSNDGWTAQVVMSFDLNVANQNNFGVWQAGIWKDNLNTDRIVISRSSSGGLVGITVRISNVNELVANPPLDVSTTKRIKIVLNNNDVDIYYLNASNNWISLGSVTVTESVTWHSFFGKGSSTTSSGPMLNDRLRVTATDDDSIHKI